MRPSFLECLLIGFVIVAAFVGIANATLPAKAAPNCRQYLDKAIQIAESAEKFAFERRTASAELATAYVRIAEACTKF